MGRVHQIVVENFKSYAGRVEIGPFSGKFTCVIGPNGAGKSNLMDAISFVLGVQARQLRSERLRDLVYRKEGEDPKKNQRSAAVELTYIGEEGDTGDAAGTLVFKRTILRGGEAKFFVNDAAVSQADYHKRLESINIRSKVRNFLVFQGDVEATAQRQGKDLTAFFEQISGSDAYREEYERLEAEKARKEENARYLFSKKSHAIKEKNRVALQKDEADEFRRLEAERGNLQSEFFLFRLHGIAQQLEESARGRASASTEQRELQAAVEKRQQGAEAAERGRAQARLEAQQAEKALAGARARLDRVNPDHVAARSRLAFLRQRIEELREDKDRDQNRKGRLESQVQLLRQEQDRLEAEERELAARAAQAERVFSAEQRAEFERVRRETERLTAASNDGVRQLEHQIRAVGAERAQVENDHREAFARQDFLKKRVAELKEAEGGARLAFSRSSAVAQQRGAEFGKHREARIRRAEELEQLQEERQQLMDTVQDITATERQLERERQLMQVCSSLAGAVPGVHGRVVDLCRPAQKRLHVAVNVALGKYLDAIIVDSTDTARACVRYLKERMLAPMTFLPLADLRVAPVDARLQELVSNERAARLGLNCVTFDERLARAFEFILGDVVVADTMADGRRLAFGEARSMGIGCKVVTLAGEAIAKNGNLSVNSEATREGATRFDLSELDGTKSRLDAIDRRLQELHQQESAAGADLAGLQEEARRAEAKASDTEAKCRWCQEQLALKSQELVETEQALAVLAPAVAKLTDDEARLRKEQRDLEKHMGDNVAGYFAELSKSMGVPDVLKVEREWRRERELAQKRQEEMTRQLHNVRAELKMMEQTLTEKGSKLMEGLLPKLQAEAAEVARKEAELSKAAESLVAEVFQHETKVKELAEVEREKDKVLVKLRNEAKDKRQQLMAVEKRLSDLGSQEQALCNARADILRQSALEDIEIPLLRGSYEALQDLAEAPSQAPDAPTQPQPGGGLAPAVALAAEVAVDFGALPEEKKAASTGPAAKLLEEEYRAELERLRVEMQRKSPNLKAIEQIRGVAENLQAASKEADLARREIEEMGAQFEQVRVARKERFLECFKKVADEIGNVYKRLTSNTAGIHADGGAAYLDLEDTDNPFNGGIKYTAMPPAKRFRDMHLLSGGEKTLAAMALLFAVHAYQKPPFMVLDEVDAALDANNVRALAGYVEQAECQTIVISLKDRFFVRGEALVGVWKNKPKETSAVLTLDLTRYQQGPSS